MKVYIWDTWKVDYTSGVLAIIAKSADHARKIFQASPEYTRAIDYHKRALDADLNSEPREVPLKAGIIVDIWGGG